MSRPLRIEYQGAWYHAMNRGRRGEAIFRNQADYALFLDLLREATTMWNVRIAGYCLMPNHHHLLVQTPDANLSRFMRHVDGVYTQRFNRAHNCDGSLFRGRYKAILVEADTYLLELLRYIHRNPLRAGLVNSLHRYRWSSHSGYVSHSRRWSWLSTELILSMLSGDQENRALAYQTFMSEPESPELMDLFSRRKVPSLLGSEGFIGWVRAKFHNLRDYQEIPERRLLAPGLEAIKSAVCAEYQIDRSQLLRSNRGMSNQARNVAMYLARRFSGETLKAIGKAFGLGNYSSVSSVVSRMKSEIQGDTKMRRRVERIGRQLRMSQAKA
jgi:putative transposase